MQDLLNVIICGDKESKKNDDNLKKNIIQKIVSLKNPQWAPEKIFLITALFFGVLMLLITPPFQGPDEDAHFLRAYAVADGRFVNHFSNSMTETGDMLPKSLVLTIQQSDSYRIRRNTQETITYQTIFNLFKIPLKPDDKEFAMLFMANYPPVIYIPQTFGIWIGKLFHAPPIALMYIGRLCNLLCWILLMTMAIRLIPAFKWVALLLALTPMSIFLSAGLSSDTLVNAASFFWIALILNGAFSKESLGKKEIVLLFVMGCFVALCKQLYIPLLLLYFLIPFQKMKTKNIYLLVGISLIASGILFNFLWSQLILQGYPFSLKTVEDIKVIQNARPFEKLQFILTHPRFHIQTIWFSFFRYLSMYLNTFIGNLGWLDTPLPKFCIYSYQFILVVFALTDHKANVSIFWKHKLGIVLLIIMPVVFLLFTAASIMWNSVSSIYIRGIQGRYFIPIAPLILLLLYNHRIKNPLNRFSLLTSAYLWMTLSIVTVTLIQRYYLGS